MKKWLVAITVLILVCAVALWFFQDYSVKEEPLSRKEAIAHIEDLYNGQVKKIEKQGHQYKIELLRDGATYEVAIDASTRQITDLLLKKAAKKRLLSEAQIRTHLIDYAPGEIESLILEDGIYKVKIENERTIKNLTMDAYTGAIISKEDIPKEVDKPKKEKTLISRQEAINIALQELKGDVDSVEYKETADGGYYEIEIESDNDEANFKIHGVTGEVISVGRDEDD